MKYYDEDKICIAGRGTNGELLPTREKLNDDLSFLSQLDEIDETQAFSLKEIDKTITEVSKILGIDKSDVLSLSQIELDQVIKNKETGSLDLSEDKKDTPIQNNQNEHNKNILQNLNIKQDIDLSKRFDNKNTLADKLNLDPSDHLVIVYSNTIENNENSTRFTPVVKHADGTLEKAENLIQVGGKDSDKTVYEVDKTGENVKEKDIKSSFMVEGSNEILTVNYGKMGTIEVGFGEMDRTSNREALTQMLQARNMYPVTSRVREEFSQNKGINNIPKKMDEIQEHKKYGCDNLTLNEADGNPDTGHFHSDEVVEAILSDENVGKTIDDCFTENEITNRFEFIKEKNPSLDFDKLIEITKAELATDADFMRHERTH